MKAWTYLMLNLGSVLFPFILSFDKKVAFWKQWKYIFPAIFLTAAFFIGWDILFAYRDIWAFSDNYTLRINILHLPIEEWLFFICVPYACLFIYEVLKVYIQREIMPGTSQKVALVSGIFLLAGAFFSHTQLYTLVAFATAGLLLLLHALVLKKGYLGMFFLAYLVQLIPFLLINGILTALPVVIYNNQQNLDIRIWTIPIEDSMYSLAMLLMNVSIFEGMRERKKNPVL